MNGPHPTDAMVHALPATPEQLAAIEGLVRGPGGRWRLVSAVLMYARDGEQEAKGAAELEDKCEPPLSLGGKTEFLASVAAGSAVKEPKSEIGGRTLEGPDMSAEFLREIRLQRELLVELQAEVRALARGNGQIEPGEPKIVMEENIRTMGRLRYREGWGEVWVGEERFDLRKRRPAQLCLEFLMMKGAFEARSARHFVEEIDPYVRSKGELGKSGKFSVLKIQQYFNDRKGRLPKLRKELIRSAGGNGKYYLQTDADLTQHVSPCFT